jgi:hypothetical protein
MIDVILKLNYLIESTYKKRRSSVDGSLGYF